MSALSPAMQGFVDYFGGLGARWGLPSEACRAHAYLYLVARPLPAAEIASPLGLDEAAAEAALAFLADFRMIEPAGPGLWTTGDDPWEMLTSGLAERRRREVAPGLATLRDCHALARADAGADRGVTLRIGRLLTLAEDLAAIEAQGRRLSPQVLKGLVGLSGRAARFVDRSFDRKKGDPP